MKENDLLQSEYNVTCVSIQSQTNRVSSSGRTVLSWQVYTIVRHNTNCRSLRSLLLGSARCMNVLEVSACHAL
jgi:hypothetical protein